MRDAIRRAFLDIMDGTPADELENMTGLPTERCKEIVNLYKVATCGDTTTCYKTTCAWNHNKNCEHTEAIELQNCTGRIKQRPKPVTLWLKGGPGFGRDQFCNRSACVHRKSDETCSKTQKEYVSCIARKRCKYNLTKSCDYDSCKGCPTWKAMCDNYM